MSEFNLEAALEVIKRDDTESWGPKSKALLSNALRALCGKQEEEKTYSIGDRFDYVGRGKYMLVRANEHEAIIVNAKTGDWWDDPQNVVNHQRITPKEFSLIAGGQIYCGNFTRIERP